MAPAPGHQPSIMPNSISTVARPCVPRLAHRRQIVGRPGGKGDVVVADDRDIFGNLQTQFEPQRVHHGEGHVIIADKNRVRTLVRAYMSRTTAVASSRVYCPSPAAQSSRPAAFRPSRNPRSRSCPVDDPIHPCNVGDALMPAGHQELGNLAPARHIVRRHPRKPRLGVAPVEQNNRYAGGVAAPRQLVVSPTEAR